jgi:hypothetical protein
MVAIKRKNIERQQVHGVSSGRTKFYGRSMIWVLVALCNLKKLIFSFLITKSFQLVFLKWLDSLSEFAMSRSRSALDECWSETLLHKYTGHQNQGGSGHEALTKTESHLPIIETSMSGTTVPVLMLASSSIWTASLTTRHIDQSMSSSRLDS